MSNLHALENLLIQEIKDLHSAECQLVNALPKMAEAATDPELKNSLQSHLEETKEQVDRLAEAAKIIKATPRGKTCKAMEGLIAEGSESVGEGGDPKVRDLAIISAAQRIEHYEMAGYGSAKAIASALGHDDVVELLEESQDEESAAERSLTLIGEDIICDLLASEYS